jgi:hypothetical protein
MATNKRIFIIAGPNGAGKTTFALEFLPREADCPDFINVDLIAAGLSPFDPGRAAIRAGRLMLTEINNRVRDGKSFAFETTLSGQAYARLIPKWRANGYYVKRYFLICQRRIWLWRAWRRGSRKVDTTWPSQSFAAVLIVACETSLTSIGPWSIGGSGTIIQASHRI